MAVRWPLISTATTHPIDLSPGLIDGDAVWSDQRVSSFPPAVSDRGWCLGTIGPQTAMFHRN